MDKTTIAIKAEIISVQVDGLEKRVADLKEEIEELRHQIAYVNMLEELDREYGDLFETHKEKK